MNANYKSAISTFIKHNTTIILRDRVLRKLRLNEKIAASGLIKLKHP